MVKSSEEHSSFYLLYISIHPSRLLHFFNEMRQRREAERERESKGGRERQSNNDNGVNRLQYQIF